MRSQRRCLRNQGKSTHPVFSFQHASINHLVGGQLHFSLPTQENQGLEGYYFLGFYGRGSLRPLAPSQSHVCFYPDLSVEPLSRNVLYQKLDGFTAAFLCAGCSPALPAPVPASVKTGLDGGNNGGS